MVMQTSKDLAFKSFCDGFKMKAYWKNYRAKLSDKDEDEQIKEFLQDHFEHWWSTWYSGNDHREGNALGENLEPNYLIKMRMNK